MRAKLAASIISMGLSQAFSIAAATSPWRNQQSISDCRLSEDRS
jgi:hypothetical protein